MPEMILNVENSLSNNRWVGNSIDVDRQTEFLMQRSAVTLLTATTLANREVGPEDVSDYLNPKIKNLMPDPCLLTHMRKATKRVLNAVHNQENIVIYADFDVDGTASAALLLLWLKHNNIEAELYIPNRITEGYGPNLTAFKKLAKNNSLLVCVDSGTQSFEPVEAAQLSGCDVIIIDHHQVSDTLPSGYAIINPKKQNEDERFFDLCTAALVFLFISDLNRISRKSGRSEFDLLKCTDLVALATMADVVPLKGLNRALVVQGLKVISKFLRPCFAALAKKANFKSPISAQALAYVFAPRINAAGRVGDAKLATKIFTSEDLLEAETYAEELENMNNTRKKLEKEKSLAAFEQARAQHDTGQPILWASGIKWHPGIIGIVAARIKDEFKKPTVVIAISENGVGTGSARSTPNIDIGSYFLQLKEKKLIISGGGHSMAAGLKIEESQINEAREASVNSLKLIENPADNRFQINTLLSTSAVSVEDLEELNLAGPFGAESPPPIVAFPNSKITHFKLLNEKHMKIFFTNDSKTRLEGILFNAIDIPMGKYLLNNKNKNVHLAGQLEINEWGGRKKINVIVQDIANV